MDFGIRKKAYICILHIQLSTFIPPPSTHSWFHSNRFASTHFVLLLLRELLGVVTTSHRSILSIFYWLLDMNKPLNLRKHTKYKWDKHKQRLTPVPNAQTHGDWNIRILDWRWSWWSSGLAIRHAFIISWITIVC